MKDIKKCKLWNKSLSFISVLNIVVIFYYILINLGRFTKEQIILVFLSSVFVIVCAIRSIWPRCDGSKMCMYNNTISSPFLGRSLATIAEISFAALIVITTNIILKDTNKLSHVNLSNLQTYNWILIPFIVIAQLFCWYGITTFNPIWNAIEESIWTFFGISKTIIYIIVLYVLVYFSPNTPKSKHLQKISVFAIIFSLCYVIFMIFIDVPMYIKRYRNHKGNFIDIKIGLKKLMECQIITKSYEDWKNDIPWLSLYFSFAVWISIAVLYWYSYYKLL